jgi:hypothetical protein
VIAENKVEAERALPGAIATAEQTLTLIDEMIGDAKVSTPRPTKLKLPKAGRRSCSQDLQIMSVLGVPGDAIFGRFRRRIV